MWMMVTLCQQQRVGSSLEGLHEPRRWEGKVLLPAKGGKREGGWGGEGRTRRGRSRSLRAHLESPWREGIFGHSGKIGAGPVAQVVRAHA